MGQAFRRASGKIRATSSSEASKTVVERKPMVNSTAMEEGTSKIRVDSNDRLGENLQEKDPTLNNKTIDNDLEEKDPQYDAMLREMVGRIKIKPGGKPETSEAPVMEKYRRPLPKLRNTKIDSTRSEEIDTPPGTLNVAQLRQIIKLHEGKSEDHNGPMEIQQIAERFRVDVAEVQRILQYVSLPPEDDKKNKTASGHFSISSYRL